MSKKKRGGAKFSLVGRPSGKGKGKSKVKSNKPKPKPMPKSNSTSKPHTQPSQQKPTIPFSAEDDILLVGDGDFSYAHSLLKYHRHNFHSLCVTTFESREALLEKHPQTEGYIRDLEAGKAEGVVGEDEDEAGLENGLDEAAKDDKVDESDHFEEEGSLPARRPKGQKEIKVLYNVDATKLQKQKYIKTRKWNRIIFNFPHVGGKSKDVNRQVRYNQELLVSFFKSAMSLLSPSALRLGPYAGREPGAIVVTLFEGTPYTLWNIRDLARHAGLAVETSFVFQANTYPGYQHARTLGNLKRREGPKHATGVNVRKGGDEDENIETDDDDKESEEEDDTATTPASAWRGENRAARTYIFKLKDEVMQKPPQKGQVLQAKKSKKRKAGPDDSDSDGEGDGVKAGRVPLLTQDDLRPQPSGKRFKHVRALPR